jgi:hypothetical protein
MHEFPRRLAVPLLTIAAVACAADSTPPQDCGLVARWSYRFPAAKQLFEETRRASIESYESATVRGVLVRPNSTADAAADKPVEAGARSTRRSIDAILPSDAREPFILRQGATNVIRVRRAGALESTGKVEQGSIAYQEAFSGVDALVFARPTGVEELLVVKAEEARIAYDVELPTGWRLVQPAGVSWLVEIRDPRDIAWQRVVARKAWDADGNERHVELGVSGTRVTVRLGPGARWPVLVDPEWQDTQAMAKGRVGHTSTLLSNGKVLLTGGDDDGLGVEVFDPQSGTFTQQPAMRISRHHATATLFQHDARVMIAGGNQTDTRVEWYNPLAEAGEEIITIGPATLSHPRIWHSATLTQAGDVLFVGGGCLDDHACTVPDELFVTRDGLFRELPTHATEQRSGPSDHPGSAALLFSGKLIIATEPNFKIYDPETLGLSDTNTRLLSTKGAGPPLLLPSGNVSYSGCVIPAEFPSSQCSPDSEQVSGFQTLIPRGDIFRCRGTNCDRVVPPEGIVNSSIGGQPRNEARATLTTSGTLLITGGCDDPSALSWPCAGLPSVGFVDPLDDVATGIGALAHGAAFAASSTLQGETLLAGGILRDHASVVASAQIFDARTLHTQTVSAMSEGRVDSVIAVLDPEGHTLVAGGWNGTDETATAEVYSPLAKRFFKSHPMQHARRWPTGITLFDRWALIGGASQGLELNPKDPEFFNLSTMSFRPVASGQGRAIDDSAMLLSGNALTIDGTKATLFDLTATAKDGMPGVFRKGPPLSGNERSVLALHDGTVLVYGNGAEVYHAEPPPSGHFEPVAGFEGIASGRGSLSSGVLLDSEQAFILGPSVSRGNLTAQTYEPHSKNTTHWDPPSPRGGSALAALPGARVAVMGGTDNWGASSQIDIYDPGQRTVSSIAPVGAHLKPSVATLPTGDIIIAGGFASSKQDQVIDYADLFDPLEGKQKRTINLVTPIADAVPVALDNGDILFIGGRDRATRAVSSTQLYHAGVFINGPRLTHASFGHVVLRMPDGRILISGGTDGSQVYDTIEIYDQHRPADMFEPLGTMTSARAFHAGTLLDNGQVVFVGGTDGQSRVSHFEMFDPASLTFVIGGSLHTAGDVNAIPLFGGRAVIADHSSVRIVHSADGTAETVHASIEVGSGTYTPGGLIAFSGWRSLARLNPAAAPPAIYGVIPSNVEGAPFSVLTQAGDVLVGSNSVVPGDTVYGVTPRILTENLHFAQWSMTPTGVVRPAITSVSASNSAPSVQYDGVAVAAITTTKPFTLTGARFTHMSAVGSENATPNPAIVPIVVFVPMNPGVPVTATTTSWSDNRLSAVFPPTVYLGPGWLFVLVEAVPSMGRFVTLQAAPQATKCTYNGDCATGFCVDGVCCDSQCSGACEACTSEKQDPSERKDGVCLPAERNAPSPKSTRARDACPMQDQRTCGTTGACDGVRRDCAHYPDMTECGIHGYCEHDHCFEGTYCDETGQFVLGDPSNPRIDCQAYRCRRGQCAGSCEWRADCADGFVCDLSRRCTPKDSGSADPGGGCLCSHDSSNSERGWIAFTALALVAVGRRARSRHRRAA